jgi:hypothetical protein
VRGKRRGRRGEWRRGEKEGWIIFLGGDWRKMRMNPSIVVVGIIGSVVVVVGIPLFIFFSIF